jgi:hypothetical protein
MTNTGVIPWITMVISVMPTGVVSTVEWIIPRIIPYISVETSPMVAIVPSPMMVPMASPWAPTERITHSIAPIQPVVCRREYIGIQPVVIDIPIPAGP